MRSEVARQAPRNLLALRATLQSAPPMRLSSLADAAAFAPLKERTFRMLWLAWLAANMTMWMNDVAAAWLMTQLTTSPVMVGSSAVGVSSSA